jgi:hypothetical protein
MGAHDVRRGAGQKVEKKPVGLEMGGQMPLNPLYSRTSMRYFTVGEILEHFCGVAGASKDPTLAVPPRPVLLPDRAPFEATERVRDLGRGVRAHVDRTEVALRDL